MFISAQLYDFLQCFSQQSDLELAQLPAHISAGGGSLPKLLLGERIRLIDSNDSHEHGGQDLIRVPLFTHLIVNLLQKLVGRLMGTDLSSLQDLKIFVICRIIH